MAGRYSLAVDLGGTKLETALVTEAGALLPASRFRAPTGPDVEPGPLLEQLGALVRRTLEALPPEAVLSGAGIGSAGPVAPTRGTTSPINLPRLADLPIAASVRDAVGDVPVTLRLDGSCIALAESVWGATRGAANSMSLVVSTGIGGGIIAGGALLTGTTGNAGHFGQLRVGSVADCEPGTVEEVASGPASVRWAQSRGWSGMTGEDLARSWAAGEPVALDAVRRSADALAEAIADAVTLLDASIVAIGGGFSRVAPDYVARVQDGVRRYALHDYVRGTRVVPSGLGDTGPLLGAGALALFAERI